MHTKEKINGELTIRTIQENLNFPANIIVTLSMGDIAFTSTGKFPKRNSDVI